MASPALAARLRYLHDSSHFLALTSPSTSSFMQTEFNRLALENDLTLPNTRRRETCSACGNIFVPGINVIVRQQSQRPISRKVSKKEKARKDVSVVEATTTTVYSCNRCSRKTRLVPKIQPSPKPSAAGSKAACVVPSPAPLSASVESSAGPSTPTASSATSPAAAVVPSANASSKKRAKARKQGSLQAALAKSKIGPAASGSAGGFGLDLMDLMKTD